MRPALYHRSLRSPLWTRALTSHSCHISSSTARLLVGRRVQEQFLAPRGHSRNFDVASNKARMVGCLAISSTCGSTMLHKIFLLLKNKSDVAVNSSWHCITILISFVGKSSLQTHGWYVCSSSLVIISSNLNALNVYRQKDNTYCFPYNQEFAKIWCLQERFSVLHFRVFFGFK